VARGPGLIRRADQAAILQGVQIDQFIASFDQFRTVDPVIIASKLAEAAARMGMPGGSGPGARIWGSYAAPGQPLQLSDFAQGNLTAYLLSSSPTGNATALDGRQDTAKNHYLQEYEKFQDMVGGGFVVANGGFPVFGGFGGLIGGI
jgi:hypothetical protein